jgi:hypothetical protein
MTTSLDEIWKSLYMYKSFSEIYQCFLLLIYASRFFISKMIINANTLNILDS